MIRRERSSVHSGQEGAADMSPLGSSNKFAHYSHTNAKSEGIPKDGLAVQVLLLFRLASVGTAGFDRTGLRRLPFTG